MHSWATFEPTKWPASHATTEPTQIMGDEDADVCIVGWGSTWAAIDSAVQRCRRNDQKVAWVHIRNVFPLPNDLGDILRRYERVIVPELNRGQLCNMLRANYLVDAQPLSKVAGLPFSAREYNTSSQKEASHERYRSDSHHKERLVKRPRSSLVSGMRRLRRPPSCSAGHARTRSRS